MILSNFRSIFWTIILCVIFSKFGVLAGAVSVVNGLTSQAASESSTSRWMTGTQGQALSDQEIEPKTSIAEASDSNFSSTIDSSTASTTTVYASPESISSQNESDPQSSTAPLSPIDSSLGIVGRLIQSFVPGLINSNIAAAGNGFGVANLLPTISKLNAPLVRIIANNGTPSTSDVQQLVDVVPDIAASLGALGIAANLTNNLINGELGNGGGASTLTLPADLSAWTAEQINDLVDGNMPLPPLNTLSQGRISTVLTGGSIPGLTHDQTEAIKNRYMRSMVRGLSDLVGGRTSFGDVAKTIQDSASAASEPLIGNILTNISQNLNLSKISTMTPNLMSELSNLGLSQLPTDVIQNLLKGETPDLSRIPSDFFQKLINNPQIFGELVNLGLQKTKNDTDSSAINQPKIGTDILPLRNDSTSTGDVNSSDKKADLYHQHEDTEQAVMWIAIVSGIAGLIAVLVIAYLCYRCRNTRSSNASLSGDSRSGSRSVIEHSLEIPSTPSDRAYFRTSAAQAYSTTPTIRIGDSDRGIKRLISRFEKMRNEKATPLRNFENPILTRNFENQIRASRFNRLKSYWKKQGAGTVE